MYKGMLRTTLSTLIASSIAFRPQLAQAQKSADDGSGKANAWSLVDHLYSYESLEIPVNVLKEIAQIFGPNKKVSNEPNLPITDVLKGKRPYQTLIVDNADPEKATQTWKTFVSAFSLFDTVVKPQKDTYQTSLGYFAVQKRQPLPTTSVVSHPRLQSKGGGGALGFRIVYEFETPSEIFSECYFRESENGGLDTERLLNKIVKDSKNKDYCDAANSLRALQLKNFKLFKEKNGHVSLLHALAEGGHLLDFNREAEDYLRIARPDPGNPTEVQSYQSELELVRLYQLEGYASVLPDRHVNPRGTAAGNNFASEYVALLELFKASYPNSQHMPKVREMESKLFATYINKYKIPVYALKAPIREQNGEEKILIYKQAALVPRSLSATYPDITWTGDPNTIERLLEGKESLVETNCGCFVQESESQDPREIAEVKALGFSRLASSDKALDTCVRIAQAAVPSKKGFAFTHQCQHKPVPLSAPLMTALQEEMKAAIAQEDRFKQAYKSRPAFVQKLLVASLAFGMGALTWRCRGGGGCPSFGTQTARLFYAVIPQTLYGAIFGYLEDGWGGVKDGAIIGALMTPSLMMPWGRQMDVGRANGSKWDDFVLLMLRGYIQTAPAAWYAASVGKDPTPILVSGVAMAPVYLTSWQWGANVNANVFFDSPTALGEFGWGGVLTGYGLLKTVAPSWTPY